MSKLKKYKLLGTVGMIGAPMLLIERLYRYVAHLENNQNDSVVGVLGLIYLGNFERWAAHFRILNTRNISPGTPPYSSAACQWIPAI